MALAIFAVVLTTTVGFASCWFVFRRRWPYLCEDEEELVLSTNHKNGDALKVVRKFGAADIAALKQSFANSPDFLWIYNTGIPLATANDSEELAIQVSYLMDFVIYMAECYGHIIQSVDKEGNYQGSICLMPPVSHHLYKAYELRVIYTRMGIPPSVIWNHPKRRARFDAFVQMAEHHHDVMKDVCHWYVVNLGVAETAQGKGVGSQLLEQANHLAKDVPLYLECHDGNVAFYEKRGYVVKKKYLFQPKGADATTSKGFPFNAMVRSPKNEP